MNKETFKYIENLINFLKHHPDALIAFSKTNGETANELYKFFSEIEDLKVYLRFDSLDDLYKLDIYDPLHVFKPGKTIGFGQ